MPQSVGKLLMSAAFEEIDSQDSDLGQISLRRRRIPAFGERDIYEVKLGDEFLMSSMFVDAEVALADLGLAAIEGENLRVVVGGLGLGHTADAALKDNRIAELLVIEALDTVIGWHQQGKVPLGNSLTADPRCHYVHGSFFDLAIDEKTGFDPKNSKQQFDAILLDIDHSPSAFLNSENETFYTIKNLRLMAKQLISNGVFAMWSNEPADGLFLKLLSEVFIDVRTEEISFFNPFQNIESSNTVYLARTAN